MTEPVDLFQLIRLVADRVDVWTGKDSWTFEPGSPAAVESGNAEMRADGSPWGDRPVRTVFQLAQMATKYTVEMARSVSVLIEAHRPAPAIEVVVRSSLEAASVAWWLTEDGLGARRRVCRMQLLRRNSARELARSVAEVGADQAVMGNETVPSIEAECAALGLAPFSANGDVLEGEMRPGYTKRAKDFTDDLGYLGAYSIYSGAAHAELAGLWRLLKHTASTVPAQDPIYMPTPDPAATFAAVDGALKAMMGPVERIALLFGWTTTDKADQIGETIDHVNAELARLAP
jgi:hypothetical protein